MKAFFLTLFIISSLFSYEKIEDVLSITYKVNANYDDTIFALLDEISNTGFILSYRANIGKNIKNTSKFFKQEPVFINANKIGFCKSSLTLEMMNENPRNMMFCPLSLAVYELNKKENKVVIIYQKATTLKKEDKVMLKVNSIIEKLIENSLNINLK